MTPLGVWNWNGALRAKACPQRAQCSRLTGRIACPAARLLHDQRHAVEDGLAHDGHRLEQRLHDETTALGVPHDLGHLGRRVRRIDLGSIHKGPAVQALRARCPRLHLERFPGYAPELNPDELVWAHFKATLANGHPENLDELARTLGRITKDVRGRPDLIRSFVAGSARPSFL